MSLRRSTCVHALASTYALASSFGQQQCDSIIDITAREVMFANQACFALSLPSNAFVACPCAAPAHTELLAPHFSLLCPPFKPSLSITGEMGVVATLPLIAFFGFGVLSKDDFNGFLWNVVMLAMGGLALGEQQDLSQKCGSVWKCGGLPALGSVVKSRHGEDWHLVAMFPRGLLGIDLGLTGVRGEIA